MMAVDRLAPQTLDTANQASTGPSMFRQKLDRNLAAFSSVSLVEATSTTLANRLDKKYLFQRRKLADLLAQLAEEFDVLEIEDARLQAYSSLYFDTPDFRFYHDHHNGIRSRYKVRLREYLTSGQRFLEVKRKASDERTDKQRLELAAYPARTILTLLGATLPVDYQRLCPALRSRYERISLVHKTRNERLTIDLGLKLERPFSDAAGVQSVNNLSELVILERKTEGTRRTPAFDRLRRNFKLRESSFSKYCVGCALNYPQLKKNLFKPTLKTLATIIEA